MKDTAPSFHIRPARANEATRLREIEDKAGEMFGGLGLINEAFDDGYAVEDLDRFIQLGHVWVACNGNDMAVGMVIVSEMDDAVYIEEMDVLPESGRRGIGASLLEHACKWAYQQGYKAVTLSTFRNVPWNAPFYSKHGFKELDDNHWSQGMHRIRKKEMERGLLVEARIFMKRDLAAMGELQNIKLSGLTG